MLASRLLGRGTHPVRHSERSEESLLGAPIEEEARFLVASLLGMTTGAQAKRVIDAGRHPQERKWCMIPHHAARSFCPRFWDGI